MVVRLNFTETSRPKSNVQDFATRLGHSSGVGWGFWSRSRLFTGEKSPDSKSWCSGEVNRFKIPTDEERQ